mmetsp:Transcript_2835/g.6690  ORF Transcript_2835/g.6690 Transcript_2835/m.6690 type:complete len:1015 (-) Transcript_2835:81-3125(-)
MENLARYINTVQAHVRGLVESRRLPTPEQLNQYIKNVVDQMQKLTKGAPRDVIDGVALPFKGLWNFFKNEPLKVQLSVVNFLGILEELQEKYGHHAPAVEVKLQSGAVAPAQGKGAPAKAAEAKGGYGKGAAPAPAAAAAAAAADDEGSLRAEAAVFVPGTDENKQLQNEAGRLAGKPPVSEFSKTLPTYKKREFICAAVRRNRVTVISGDTGCGKSTLIPQLVCDAADLVPEDKVVVCTQPRRVAAITLAQRVAEDRGQELGDEVGYQIRFVNNFSEHTRLIYATTAIVLRRLHSEADLGSIGCLIVDEVHERDVYTDFLLLLLRDAMLAGKINLKLILMSATLKADDFANYFMEVNGTMSLKPVHIEGRMFDVETFYWEDAVQWLNYVPPQGKGKSAKGGRKGKGGYNDDYALEQKKDEAWNKLTSNDRTKDKHFSDRVLTAVASWKPRTVYLDVIEDLVYYFHRQQPKGDGAILIFLPGWGDISKLYLKLFASGENFKLITLHSLMTPEQQHEAFVRPPVGLRKVVLSTNIAEASVTIDDVVYVIDSGVMKERSYDPETGISSLDTKVVTKANSVQRRGRAGRVQEGLAVHLFPSYELEGLAEFPTPQMLSSSMEEVVLQSKVIHGGSFSQISDMLHNSMAAPKHSAVQNGVQSLIAMHCLTKSGELTVLGRAVAAIPVQPNVAKMLLIAGAFRCIKPCAVIAAFLSLKSPFQQTAGQKDRDAGKEYFDRGFGSDHLTQLQAYVEWRRAVKAGRGDDFCDQKGLSPEMLDMAHMMVCQFVNFMVDAGYDGDDVQGDSDSYGDLEPVAARSKTDAMVRAALTMGFQPQVAILYQGNQKPYWYVSDGTADGAEVSPFMGSSNSSYPNPKRDGDEWMVFSDSMKMGRFNSIMDSTMITSRFVVLFANALMTKGNEVRFDMWWARTQNDKVIDGKVKQLRRDIQEKFANALETRELSAFPRELCNDIATFVMGEPLELAECTAVPKDISEEAKGSAQLSAYEWRYDPGPQDDDQE